MAMNTRLAIKTKQNQNLLYIKRKLHLKLLVSIWFKRWHTYYFYSFKNWDNTSWKLAGNRLNGLIWQSYLCECRVSFRKCIIFEIIYMWDHLPVIKFDLVNLINFLYMHFGQHIFSQIKRGGGGNTKCIDQIWVTSITFYFIVVFHFFPLLETIQKKEQIPTNGENNRSIYGYDSLSFRKIYSNDKTNTVFVSYIWMCVYFVYVCVFITFIHKLLTSKSDYNKI